MHIRFFISAILLLLLSPLLSYAQRLAILPQNNMNIVKGKASVFKSLPIDYHNDALRIGQPFTQVYQSGTAVIRINGNVVNRTFADITTGQQPLLLLQASSPGQVGMSINTASPEAKTVSSIGIQFKTPAFIGITSNDTNLTIARTVFATFGTNQSATEFLQAVMCLQVLQKNGLLQTDDKGMLTSNAMAAYHTLNSQLDLYYTNGKVFKTLLDNNYIKTDAQGNIMRVPLEGANDIYDYYTGLEDARRNAPCKLDTAGGAAGTVTAKQQFYSTYGHLAQIDEASPAKDTLISGERYILMTSWKSMSYWGFMDTTQPGLPFTTTENAILGNYPLFVTAEWQFRKWCRDNKLYKQTNASAKRRLRQLLGLTPTSSNDLVIEFWVKESAIFRPATDSSLHSIQRLLAISNNYLTALRSYADNSYSSNSLLGQYPFWGNGITYDWNPANSTHFGLSEFVVRGAERVYVRRKLSTANYLAEIKSSVSNQ